MFGKAIGKSVTNEMLPEKLLVGYVTNHCNDLDDMAKVTKAVEDGLNVLIWSFISFQVVDDDDDDDANNACPQDSENESNSNKDTLKATPTPIPILSKQKKLRVKVSQNLENYKKYKKRLSSIGDGSTDNNHRVKHLVAFGGWNGPHLPSGFSGQELYDAFKAVNEHNDDDDDNGHGRLWDGIDWDLEGHDEMDHPNNLFRNDLLDQMGEMSQAAKDDGLVVSMAPPESYLDVPRPRFSRYVNLTYTDDDWHSDFRYHGWNVYAYVLAKYGESIDFVLVQFYESYSHALYQIQKQQKRPSDFLIAYTQTLAKHDFGYMVHFEDDPTVGLRNQFVSLPLSKLVFGFANGWALDNNNDNDNKTLFVPSLEFQRAYTHLSQVGLAPRGCGFWVVDEEGTHGVSLIEEFNDIMNNVSPTQMEISQE